MGQKAAGAGLPQSPEGHDSLAKDTGLVHSSRFFISVRSSENKMPEHI